MPKKRVIEANGDPTNEPPLRVAHWKFGIKSKMPKKWVIAANGDPTNEPPWGSALKIEFGAENIMPTPLTGGG